MEDTRRANFERIVRDRGDLEVAAEDAYLEGERLLSTANAVYRLLDSVCISVDDLSMTGRPGALVGMRLVGWIPLSADAVIDTWEPGASALFSRTASPTTAARLAVTSAVFDLAAPSIVPARESYVRETRVSVPRPDVRFGPPQRESSVTNIHALLASAASTARAGKPRNLVSSGPSSGRQAPPLPARAKLTNRR